MGPIKKQALMIFDLKIDAHERLRYIMDLSSRALNKRSQSKVADHHNTENNSVPTENLKVVVLNVV
ncbi:hypothetical protein YK48G_09610 [Lentilactobacillus fungorum]|uniref:Uncharacterized protein n=1 Tax=Lentilactobacillus fungorum TaxID=2201250 RepID=A0ABQ3VYM8_9LACO|nr:hypothetical protein YK48G_09610 [Lentilactobacillus fungorum]